MAFHWEALTLLATAHTDTAGTVVPALNLIVDLDGDGISFEYALCNIGTVRLNEKLNFFWFFDKNCRFMQTIYFDHTLSGAHPVGSPVTSNTGDAVLVYEPIYNCNIPTCLGNTLPANTWQTWTITQSQGLWWDVRGNAAPNPPCGIGCETLGDIVIDYPNAQVYGYMDMGDITAPGYSSNTYGVASAQTVDFNPYPVIPWTDSVND
jgi:hypothetical protein